MSSIKNFLEILGELEHKKYSAKELNEKGITNSLDLLVDLENIGFIERVEKDVLRISQIHWSITNNGKSFLRIYSRLTEKDDFEVVMTIPPTFSKDLIKKHPFIKKTELAIKQLFSQAKNEIRVLSPYVDASIISFIDNVKPSVLIKIITLPSSFGAGKNTILERLKSKKNIQIKYIQEIKERTQIYQIHAKITIVDQSVIYIGSANFKDTSIYYNLESGVTFKDETLIAKYTKIYDDIYDNYAK